MTRKLLSALLLTAFALPAGLSIGCRQEVSHNESDKEGFFGGRKHEETTVYKNPDGTTSVDKKVERSNNP